MIYRDGCIFYANGIFYFIENNEITEWMYAWDVYKATDYGMTYNDFIDTCIARQEEQYCCTLNPDNNFKQLMVRNRKLKDDEHGCKD